MKNDMDIRELYRPNIRSLAPYSTARDEYRGELGIFLDANENPYDNGCNRYPDPRQRELKRRLSEIKGVAPEKIFVGNGSDEPIDLAFRVFCEPRLHNAVSIAPTYGMYKVAAAINDVPMREVPLEPDFSLDERKLLAATDRRYAAAAALVRRTTRRATASRARRSSASSARSPASSCSTRPTSISPTRRACSASWTASRI